MRVIAKKILREFWQRQNDSENQLKTWYKEASKAIWTSPGDIKSKIYYEIKSIKNRR